MTEIQPYQPQPVQAYPVQQPAQTFPVAPVEDPTGGRLIAWASGLSAAHQIGSALCQTEFVPKEFRGKPEAAAAAILFGDEIGLTPTQALQSVYVVSGRPGLYARSMVALVLRHGHEIWTTEKTDSKVTVCGRRRGSQHVIEETWTVARAQKAGYTSNKKYQTDPAAMLYARAAADVARQVAPDALAGLAYSVEELELSEPEPTVTVTRTTTPAKAQRKPRPTPAPPAEPDLQPPAAEPEQEPGPELRSEPQMRKLWALAKKLGLGSGDDFKAYIVQEIGRDLASTKELTKAEAGALIEQLEGIEPSTGEIPAEDGAMFPEAGQ